MSDLLFYNYFRKEQKTESLKAEKDEMANFFNIYTLRIFPGGFYVNFLTTAHTHAQMSTKY